MCARAEQACQLILIVVESDDEAQEAELRQGAHSWRGDKCFMFKQTRYFVIFQLSGIMVHAQFRIHLSCSKMNIG